MSDIGQKIASRLETFADHLESGGSLQEWKDNIELKRELRKKETEKRKLEFVECLGGGWENAMNRMFSYNEVFGPFECDICGEEAWYIIVSEQEEKELPKGDRFEKSCYVAKHSLGLAICNKHMDEFVAIAK